MLTVELGLGEVVISDIRDNDGEWAGVCFTRKNCEIGEEIKLDGKTDIEVGAFLRIIATDMRSIDVLISACERAKMWMPNAELSGALD